MEDLQKEIMRASLAPVPEEWNELTHRVIGCAMEVHSVLGPGLIEQLYEQAMIYELQQRGIPFHSQVPYRVKYKDILLPEQRLDILVADMLVLELKAIEKVPEFHLAKMVGYMKIADAPLGLLINFNVLSLKDGIFRRLNPRASRLRKIAGIA